MKTLAEKIAIMQAYLDGKKIEINRFGTCTWHDVDEEPLFNWKDYDYRVKPVIREGWINLYDMSSNVYDKNTWLSAGCIHKTKSDALACRPSEIHKTVKITWEE